MTSATLSAAIADAWERRAALSPATLGADRDAVLAALDLLDSGQARVAEPGADGWVVHQWLKQAVLLSFRLFPNIPMGSGDTQVFDKVATKFGGWDAAQKRFFGDGGVFDQIYQR